MAHNGTAAHLSLAPEFPDVKQLPAILDAEPGDTRFGPARLTVVSGASGAYFGDIKRVFGVPKEIVLVANPGFKRKLVEEHIKQMEQVFDDVRQVEEHIEASIDKLRTSGDVRVKERGRPDAGDAAEEGERISRGRPDAGDAAREGERGGDRSRSPAPVAGSSGAPNKRDWQR